jgi:hypothetical protein
MLGDIPEDQIGRDWRNLIQSCFSKLALDIIFAGKAEAAVKLQAGIRRRPGRVGRQISSTSASYAASGLSWRVT